MVVHVIVVGAGEVGSYVAARLSRERHNVAVVDVDADRLRQIGADLDVLTVEGSGTHPSVLFDAGLDSCELVVAVTSNDEVNLVVSLIAKQRGVDKAIVRIEAEELRGKASAELRQTFRADLVIDPDYATAERILDLLDYPGASEIALMAHGEAIVMGARLEADAPIVGRRLSEIAAEYEPDWEFMVGSISRGEDTYIPRADYMLLEDDLVRVVCKRRARHRVAKLLGLGAGAVRHVLLLGGGRTAEILAARLVSRGVEVVIVERDAPRALELAEHLADVQVFEGDITDADLLEETNLGRFDVVAALTGEDESNILACLYAKSVGASETIAVVHKLALLSLLDSAGVDVSLSPRTATADGVMRFVRGDVAAVTTFLESDAEVLELEVEKGSPADEALVKDLKLPKGVLIGAIVRDGKPQIARGRSRLRGRDHVVAFATPGSAREVHRLLTCED
ncbi:MAG: Trk system potassium transporter TrkA [Acidimicrobiaceae bacterium]|nr:Trk system potassium transporter TrkA [Acidimicrobiaceae bacterium]MYE97108.1 Trk system potassium transporter TrkA [Acidimicrobiaceae bacterium]MYI55257.1 Trk system potassium transporter TrkA [Acidimicrobiaceae bacterium]